jgi:hypothetical protein
MSVLNTLGNIWTGVTNSLNPGGLLNIAGQTAVLNEQLQDLREAGQFAAQGSRELGLEAQEAGQFKPFTVTSGTGGQVVTDPQGGYAVNLPGLTAAEARDRGFTGDAASLGSGLTGLQNKAFWNARNELNQYGRPAMQLTGASDRGYDPVYAKAMQGTRGLFDTVLQNPETRSQAIYDLLRQTQIPDEQRQQALLDESLVNRGRQGMRTAMFGGTPEQLAMNKALQETQAATRLKAMQMARDERADDLGTQRQLFDLSGAALAAPEAVKTAQLSNLANMLGLGYTPSQMEMASITPATNIASIADIGRRQGAGFLENTGMFGLKSVMEAEQARSDLMTQAMLGMLSGTAASGGSQSGVTSLIDAGMDLYDCIVNGNCS